LSRNWKAITGAQDLSRHRHQNKKSHDNEGYTQKAERKPAVVRLFDGSHGDLPMVPPINAQVVYRFNNSALLKALHNAVCCGSA
jgi:hypothetical protein